MQIKELVCSVHRVRAYQKPENINDRIVYAEVCLSEVKSLEMIQHVFC